MRKPTKSTTAKKNSESVWIASTTIVQKILDDAETFVEFMDAIKKDYERYLFIPWSQWPQPGKQVVEYIERMTGGRPSRTARVFRIYVVPDEIAALNVTYSRQDNGGAVIAYHHTIRIKEDVEGTIIELTINIDEIERIFREEGRQVSIYRIARCY